MGSPRLSVIIPAYNEASRITRTLESVTRYLRYQDFVAEVLVADDGSTDETPDLVTAFTSPESPVKLISMPHQGKGGAVKSGMLQARGDYRFLCDADLAMPIDQISRFFDLIQHADIVIGSRQVKGARRFHEPPVRQLMGRILNVLIRTAGGVRNIEDTQCGFKMFRREAAEALFRQQTLKAFGFDIEILYLAQRQQLRVTELGVDWYHQPDSKVRSIHDSLVVLAEMIKIRSNHLRGRYEFGSTIRTD